MNHRPNLLIGLIFALLAFLLPLAAPAVVNYLDNGDIKIGVDSTKGGSITWLSLSGATNNIVNSHDLGREIQQSYYAGPQPYDPGHNINPGWRNWPWNPIQTGDSYGHPSVVLAQTNDGPVLYVKCRPMQWALNNVPGQCTYESWITLTNNVAVVRNRLVNRRTDTARQFPAADQELPAVYTIGSLYRLISYAGNAPFTGDALTNLPDVPPPWQNWHATECWAALVNSNNWGLGVYNPGSAWFTGGFAGMPGAGGPADDATGYIAPLKHEILDTDIVYSWTYYLILGTVPKIRDWVYAQPYRPGCDFVFKASRRGWFYEVTTDAGWPVTDYLTVSLDSSDPRMVSSRTAFYATNAPVVYIRAAYQIAHPAGRAFGQVFWETDGGGGWSEARSVTFPVVADGAFHTYAVKLAAAKTYTGLITRFRFDPAYTGEPGDWVKVAAISSSPMEGDGTVK